MKTLVVHLFLPHESNNLRPRTLHLSALIFYITLFLLLQASFRIIKLTRPDILGFATDINVEKLLNLTNLKRAEAGLPPLDLDPVLSAAAASKASDMFSKGYWAHNSLDGTTPWFFITNTGYQYLYAGENLARDFSNSEGVISAWMASPTHRDNLFKKEYQDVGFAVVNGRLKGEETTLVVQFFATPQPVTIATKPVIIPPTAATIPTPSSSGSELSPTALSSLRTAGVSRHPLINFFATTKNLASLLIGILLTILFLDGVLFWRRKIVRISGHNIAHIIFLAALLGALWLSGQGVVL